MAEILTVALSSQTYQLIKTITKRFLTTYEQHQQIVYASYWGGVVTEIQLPEQPRVQSF
jgi:hypothetical protein